MRKGRVQEKAVMMKEMKRISTVEGKRMGRRKKGEEKGGTGGVRERVACLSALVPVLATIPSLHHEAHAGQLWTLVLYCNFFILFVMMIVEGCMYILRPSVGSCTCLHR